tara:strand:- start:116687 stop:117376 length:690 start_codon:yes stop_codon:yes gene_type:complete
MAFDTLHVLRSSKRLSKQCLQELATLLDFGACANAFFDSKNFDHQEYRRTRQTLADFSLGKPVDEYVRKLRELERHRPLPGGDDRSHGDVKTYREEVVRLSLGIVGTVANDRCSVESGIRQTHHDDGLNMLFRLVMFCQIIDDVLDWPHDLVAGIPSFTTGHASLSRAIELTRDATVAYRRDVPAAPCLFPLRVALYGLSITTRLMLATGRLILVSPLVRQNVREVSLR